jgi:hypothetical protein
VVTAACPLPEDSAPVGLQRANDRPTAGPVLLHAWEPGGGCPAGRLLLHARRGLRAFRLVISAPLPAFLLVMAFAARLWHIPLVCSLHLL